MIIITDNRNKKSIKAKDMKIGDVGYMTHCETVKYLVLRTYDRLVSLDNPNITWNNLNSMESPVELVDIEITVK